jgi:hypothetical protein
MEHVSLHSVGTYHKKFGWKKKKIKIHSRGGVKLHNNLLWRQTAERA